MCACGVVSSVGSLHYIWLVEPDSPSLPTLVADNAFMQNSGHCDRAGAGGYNETTFVQTMDALVSSGLKDAG